ncbi:DUF998 domain-containing protein [Luteimonas gilva]|uniref:DUF998 domain-containing protein n=1 Tax=Luteimonas gilva TaxID=2572684 RepID=A0A4U5JSN3_9GAMM|nr:DUF998 domain-containing protein [Luteimonas gilva]TKR32794.1 DUF998 domain-containing protein [Luteimonas gilva]
MSRSASRAGLLAGAAFAASAFFFSLGLEGYSHRVHPLGLLGAQGIPHAVAFDIVGFLIPGLLAAWVCRRLRERVDAGGWMARIGAWMALLSCLAFAAQGLFRLDPEHLESTASRLHGVAWMLWWLAFVPGAALLAIGLRSLPKWRGLSAASALAALGVLAFAMVVTEWMPAAIAHRIAFVLWFAWLVWAGYAQSRESA